MDVNERATHAPATGRAPSMERMPPQHVSPPGFRCSTPQGYDWNGRQKSRGQSPSKGQVYPTLSGT